MFNFWQKEEKTFKQNNSSKYKVNDNNNNNKNNNIVTLTITKIIMIPLKHFSF